MQKAFDTIKAYCYISSIVTTTEQRDRMMRHLSVDVDLIDHKNPGFGYEVRIFNAETGEPIHYGSGNTAQDEYWTLLDAMKHAQSFINAAA